MKERLLRMCLLAYPRASRARDGGHLLDLALELSERSGVRRQALSLLCGGLLERARGVRRRVALVVGTAVATVLVVGGVAVADDGPVDVEVQSCAAAGTGCSTVEEWARQLELDGYRCDRTSSRGEVTLQCTRP